MPLLSGDWVRRRAPSANGAWQGSVAEHPDLYDLLFGEHTSDIPMYLSLSDGCESLLECGIGTGRVAVPLARFGRNVIGIDNSIHMLTALRQRMDAEPSLKQRLELVEADMRSFSLGRRFDLVICPFMTLNYLLTKGDQLAYLASVRDHLSSGGMFVFELMTLATLPELLSNDGLLRDVLVRDDSDGRRSAEVLRRVRFDSSTQIVEQDRYYRSFGRDGDLVRERCTTWRNRLVLLSEMELLLEGCGLVLEEAFGDHTFGSYTHESQFLVIKATVNRATVGPGLPEAGARTEGRSSLVSDVWT